MKLASRFRPRFSECLLLPRSDEKSFSSDDPRWIHAGRTTDGPTDRPTGRIRFGERDRTAGARLRLAFRRLYRNHDDVKRSTLVSKYSRRDFFFSFCLFFFFLFFPEIGPFREKRLRRGTIERGREERERGGGGGAPPSNSTWKRRRISRAVSKDDNLLRPTGKDRLTSRKRTKTALYMGSRWEGWVESLRFIRLLAATVL